MIGKCERCKFVVKENRYVPDYLGNLGEPTKLVPMEIFTCHCLPPPWHEVNPDDVCGKFVAVPGKSAVSKEKK